MAVIDLVTVWHNGQMRSMSLSKGLIALNFNAGEGMMNAIQLFGGLGNLDILCPTLAIEKNGLLCMSWTDSPNQLKVWLAKDSKRVQWTIGSMDEELDLRTANIEDVLPLIEEWAGILDMEFQRERAKREKAQKGKRPPGSHS